MRFIDRKTDGGAVKGRTAFYCDVLDVTRQGFYWYLKHRDDPWKYEGPAEKIRTIVAEDECNDTYGRCRMYQALKMKYPDEDILEELPKAEIQHLLQRLGYKRYRETDVVLKDEAYLEKYSELCAQYYKATEQLLQL